MRQGLARGTRIRILSGSRRGQTETVEATVFQKTVDYPDEYPHGFHVTLDDGTLVPHSTVKEHLRARVDGGVRRC